MGCGYHNLNQRGSLPLREPYKPPDRIPMLRIILGKVIAFATGWGQTAVEYSFRGAAKFYREDYRGAIADLNKAIKLDPKDLEAYLVRGAAKDLLEDYRGAIADYDKAIEVDPKHAMAYSLRGDSKYDHEDYRGAIADYDKAIELDPNLAMAYRLRGGAKFHLEDYRGAIADSDKAIELAPDLTMAYVGRGSAKARLKDYRGAIADYDKAITLDPNLAMAYFNRGVAKANVGNYHGAIADYNKVIELDPMCADAFNNRGTAKAEQADYPNAKTDFDRAIELAPKYNYAYTNRGVVSASLGNCRDAVADFNKAIDLDPKYGYAFLNRGNAKHNLGQYHSAMADYDKAIELDTSDYRVYYRRGITKSVLKDPQGAIDDYTKAIKLDSSKAGAYTNEGFEKSANITYKPTVNDNKSKIPPPITTQKIPKQTSPKSLRFDLQEKGTKYATDMSQILRENPRFWNIYEYNVKQMQHLTTQEMLDGLERGTAVLDDYSALSRYLASYGGHHYHKLQAAFARLFTDFGTHSDITLIDYGCGQALASVIFYDYMLRTNKVETVKKIILIEPSLIAVERGLLTLNYFIDDMKSNTDVVIVNKKLDQLNESDLQTSSHGIKIHLLSNILDVAGFDINRLTRIIKHKVMSDSTNYFVCVSPRNNTAEESIARFYNQFDSVTTMDKRSETLYKPVHNLKSRTMNETFPITMFQHIFKSNTFSSQFQAPIGYIDEDLPF